MLTALVAGVLAAILLVAGTGRLRTVRQRSGAGQRSHAAQPTDYASLLDALSRRVRTGSSISAALVEERHHSGELADVVTSIDGGVALTVALRSVRAADADLALTVQALTAAAQLGGPQAVTLDAAAAVLRERAAARAERLAYSAQARLSARVLTLVPVGFTAWNVASSESTRHLYATNVAASACAVAGIVLNLAGWQWMRKIVGPP